MDRPAGREVNPRREPLTPNARKEHNMLTHTPEHGDLSTRAYEAGQAFGRKHPYSEFSRDRDSRRLMAHCPVGLGQFADCFKYGVQAAWRESR